MLIVCCVLPLEFVDLKESPCNLPWYDHCAVVYLRVSLYKELGSVPGTKIS